MPISRVPGVGLDSGSSGVAPSNLSTGGPSWDGSGYLTSQINGTTAGQYAPMYFFRLNSGLVGANVNTAQSIFGVGVTLSANTVYAFELNYTLTKTAGTTSHAFASLFGGTATFNNAYLSTVYALVGAVVNSGSAASIATVTILTSLTYFAPTATANNTITMRQSGTLSVNAGGTFIPQYILSAAPGGAYTTVAGSYMLIYPISASGANTNIGGWA
jgi:hypothetical protein